MVGVGSRHGLIRCGQGSAEPEGPAGLKEREEGSDLGFPRVSHAITLQDGIQLVSVRPKDL